MSLPPDLRTDILIMSTYGYSQPEPNLSRREQEEGLLREIPRQHPRVSQFSFRPSRSDAPKR